MRFADEHDARKWKIEQTAIDGGTTPRWPEIMNPVTNIIGKCDWEWLRKQPQAEANRSIEYGQLDAIRRFVSEVERRAENNMLKTGKLESAHYAAMKQLLEEIGK